MIVLDADSTMAGETLLRMVDAMERNPGVGLIQTAPVIIKARTIFARVSQYSVRLYGRVAAAGHRLAAVEDDCPSAVSCSIPRWKTGPVWATRPHAARAGGHPCAVPEVTFSAARVALPASAAAAWSPLRGDRPCAATCRRCCNRSISPPC